MITHGNGKIEVEIETGEITFCCFSILTRFLEMFLKTQKQKMGTNIKQVSFLKNEKQNQITVNINVIKQALNYLT